MVCTTWSTMHPRILQYLIHPILAAWTASASATRSETLRVLGSKAGSPYALEKDLHDLAGLLGGLAAGCMKRLLGESRSTEACASDSLLRARAAAAAAAALTKKDTMNSTAHTQLTASTPAGGRGQLRLAVCRAFGLRVQAGYPHHIQAQSTAVLLSVAICQVETSSSKRSSECSCACMLTVHAGPPVRY